MQGVGAEPLTGGPVDWTALCAMAQERNPASRRAVADKIGTLLLSGRAALSARERMLVLDILRQVFHDAEMTIRRALAEHLAELPDVPGELLLLLANDEIEIARPVLLYSDALSDDDLIAIVRRHATPHQLAVAGRRTVSPPVGEVLAATGDDAVASVLLRNAGARLTGRAMAMLAQAAQRTAELGEPLLARPELTPDLACRLYWTVSVELRRALAGRFSLPREQLDRALQQTLQRLIDSTRYRTGLTQEQRALVNRLGDAGAITAPVLIQSLRVGQLELFKALFGRVTGLEVDIVHRLLVDNGGEALAVACRAARIDKGHFASMFLLGRAARPGDQVVDPRELSRVLSLYDRIAVDNALAIVEGWRADPAALRLLPRVTRG